MHSFPSFHADRRSSADARVPRSSGHADRRSSAGGAVRRIGLLLLTALPLLARSAGTESFLWNQANAAIARASSPEDFLSAAHLYRGLLDRTSADPAVLQNYGTALLLAERPAEALDAYLRAERLTGTTPTLLHDIRAATAAQAQAAQEAGPESAVSASLPWFRSVFPWHYALPLRTRFLVALAAWALFWFALPFRRHRLPRVLLFLSVLVFALFASSAALSHHANRAHLPPIPEVLSPKS